MSLSSANRAVQLIARLLDSERSTEPIIETAPQKPELPLPKNHAPRPRSIPELQGVPSRQIAGFLRALEEDPTLRMHSLLVLRNGQVLCEAAFGSQDTSLPRMTFSACKSVTALAIGILMDDGLLHPEDKLTDLFPNDCGPVARRLMKDLTVEHLLSMQTGNLFNEGGAVTETDWIHGFFTSPGLDSTKKFQYNSMNTYMLSVLVRRLTNTSLSDFLTQRLFQPMGIEDLFWETSPEGIEKGGWGLYLRAEDLGKLGQLVMDEGMWDGRQLISADFLRQATTVHAIAPEAYGDFNYGWQIWVGRKEHTFLFNGMMGQNVLGFRDSGILLVSHAGNDEAFQTSRYFALASRFFGGDFPKALPRDSAGLRDLRKTLDAIGPRAERVPTKEEFYRFAGRRFIGDAPAMGLLPLTLQAVENSYTKGFRAISIGGSRIAPVIFYEEADQLHQLICGVREPVCQTLQFHGNFFRAAVQARFTHNEEEEPVLRIQVDLLETPCQRVLKLVLGRRGVILKQEETPGAEYVSLAMTAMLQKAPAKAILSAVLGSAEQGYLKWRIDRVFAPVVRLLEE